MSIEVAIALLSAAIPLTAAILKLPFRVRPEYISVREFVALQTSLGHIQTDIEELKSDIRSIERKLGCAK